MKRLIKELFGGVWTSYYALNTNDEEGAIIRRWAEDNGYKYSDDPFDSQNIPPLTAWAQECKVSHEVHGKLSHASFVLFRYTNNALSMSEVLYSGLDSEHKWVLAFKLKQALPEFVVDGKNENTILKGFTDFQKLKLEGKFAEKFNVYIPQGDQVNVLSVIAPDIMWKLYDSHPYIDVIVAGKRVWVLMGGDKENMLESVDSELLTKLDSLIFASSDMVTELGHRARSYKP